MGLSSSQWDMSESDMFHFWTTFFKGSCLLPTSSFPLADWTMGMGMVWGGSFDEADKDSTLGLPSQQDITNLSFVMT